MRRTAALKHTGSGASALPSPRGVIRRIPPTGAAAVLGLALAAGCRSEPEASTVVQRGIEAHGGDRYEDVRVDFRFRDEDWSVIHRDGLFRYERVYEDDHGRRVVEVMTNDSTGRAVDGNPVELDDGARADVELDVNSVVYFSFLPFRLDEPAAQPRYLREETIRGEPYHAVEVTFRQEGGGPDWEDRFVHWFHAEEGTLDYLAYRFHRDDGGTRFREAVNRRERDGLLLQDYVNFHAENMEDIAGYPDSLQTGALERVSDVELEDVDVAHPADRDP